MNRRDRLLKTLRGEPVDRPAVSFYEINGLDEETEGGDLFNVYNHPSWKPLIDLACDKTDRIVMRNVSFVNEIDPLAEFTTKRTWMESESLFNQITIRIGKRTLTATTRRDPEVNTIWQVEHMIKDMDDLKTYLEIRESIGLNQIFPSSLADVSGVLEAESILGDSGIVMIDTPDPICLAAAMFDLGTFTVIATTEQKCFHRLLDVFAYELWQRTTAVAEALPGRLWRIYGPEYASPPYLHPRLFHEYVVVYDIPMIRSIHESNGFARIHCHGRLKSILDEIVSMNCDGLDPIEPPPQGDVELSYVRERYGKQIVLFGNLEASDLENLPPELFESKVLKALEEGTEGDGRGFVLLPSSCPYGRILSTQAMMNYEKMIECIEKVT